MSAKKTVLVLLLLMLPIAAALELNAPTRLPEQTVWGFTLEFGALDAFFEADVFFDGQKLFSYSNNIITPDSFESQQMLTTPRIVGNTISVVMLGQPSGEYTLLARTKLSSGQTIEEKQKTVSFVSVLDTADKAQFLYDLNQLQQSVAGLTNETNSLQNKLSSQGNLNKTQAKQLNQHLDKLVKLENALISLQQSMGAFSEFDDSSATQIAKIKSELNETKQQLEQLAPASPTGLFGFVGDGSLWLALLVIGIVVIGYFAVQYRNNQNESSEI